jgi:hypothetical protein
MKRLVKGLVGALFVLLFSQAIAFSQTTGAIAGTVVDANGAAVPNATVVIRGESGQEFTVVTNDNGTYRVPSVAAGIYVVTTTAPSFKRYVVEQVKVDIGLPTTVNVALQTGEISETVVVTGGGEVLQTQTATVGTTITGRQIQETPIASRDALDLILRLPGVASVGAPRRSSINGLPKGAIQMTLDGVDNQDNVLRSSDGFFTFVRPRVDAIDEVTVSTSNPGAESSGDGAINVRFVTKRGTNDYTGTVYWQHRNTALNSNYWYNNRDLKADPETGKAPRDRILLNQPGFAVGGPLPYPHFGEGGPIFHSGKDRAFFFVNYEQYRIPGSISRDRTIVAPHVLDGTYKYINNAGVEQSVNLFDIALQAGQVSTIDPTVQSMLTEIQSATSGGNVAAIQNDPNRRSFIFQNPTNGYREFLALRFDVNITKDHSFEYVQNRQNFHPSIDTINGFDMSFPGGVSYGQGGIRKSWVGAVRSTLTKTLVNEGRYAISGGGTAFQGGSSSADFASQGGFNLGTLGFTCPLTTCRAQTPLRTVNSFSDRSTPTHDFTDNVTWIKGNHSIGFGGQYKIIKTSNDSIGRHVPSVGFGFSSNESSTVAYTMFNDIPGANNNQINEARALYAGLVGRVLSYTNTGYLTAAGVYEPAGLQTTGVEQTIAGLYVQDTWRMFPNLTVNYGVRWQPDLGVVNLTKNQSRLVDPEMVWGTSGEAGLFNPGSTGGIAPKTVLLEVGERIFPNDYNNFAPSVGVVWSPNLNKGSFLGKVLGGEGTTVLRGGYSMSFVREGLNVASQVVAMPGGTVNISRSTAISQPVVGGPSIPSITLGTLFRTPGNVNLTPFNFNPTPAFPLTLTGTNQAFGVDPNLKTGIVHSFSFGIQRELDRNTVIEARYVGNRGVDGWRFYGINERNVIESGLAAEYKLAQDNLYANIKANRCQAGVTTANCQYNFAYFGPGTGTSPLPLSLAYIRGATGGLVTFTPGSNGTSGSASSVPSMSAASYSSSLFRDMSTFSSLNRASASPINFAANLEGTQARRDLAFAAGLPRNLQYVNGELPSGAFILGNTSSSWYDSLVVEFRRRLSDGLRVNASYVFSKAQTNFFGVSSIVNVSTSLREGGLELAKTVQPYDLTHNFKVDSTYDLPFGRGRTYFSSSNWFVNALVGGFSILPVVTWTSGSPIQIGNVQLVGMTAKDLQKAVKVRKEANAVYWLPDDIIENSVKAFNTSIIPVSGQPQTGYGSGAPTGRFIAPSGFGNCQQEIAGTCGFNNLVIYGPTFFKLDLGLTKRFAIGERRSVQLTANVLNLTNNPNFRVGGAGADVAGSSCCGSTFGTLPSGSAYRDNNTTNDPGGRVIDMLLRINF